MIHSPHLTPVRWHRTGKGEFPYAARVDGAAWEIRVNDFPAEALYTLIVAGREVADYDEWPPLWQRTA